MIARTLLLSPEKGIFRNPVLIRKSHGAKTIKNTGCSFVQPARKYFLKPLRNAHFRDIIEGVARQKSSP